MNPVNRNKGVCPEFSDKNFSSIFFYVNNQSISKEESISEKSPKVTQNFQKTSPSPQGIINQRKIPPEIPLGYHGKQKQFTVPLEKLKVSSLVMVLIKLPAEEKAPED